MNPSACFWTVQMKLERLRKPMQTQTHRKEADRQAGDRTRFLSDCEATVIPMIIIIIVILIVIKYHSLWKPVDPLCRPLCRQPVVSLCCVAGLLSSEMTWHHHFLDDEQQNMGTVHFFCKYTRSDNAIHFASWECLRHLDKARSVWGTSVRPAACKMKLRWTGCRGTSVQTQNQHSSIEARCLTRLWVLKQNSDDTEIWIRSLCVRWPSLPGNRGPALAPEVGSWLSSQKRVSRL